MLTTTSVNAGRRAIATDAILFLLALCAPLGAAVLWLEEARDPAAPIDERGGPPLLAAASADSAPRRRSRMETPAPGAPSASEIAPLPVPEELSPFQAVALEKPVEARRLHSRLIGSLSSVLPSTARCGSRAEESVLQFLFKVRSRGPLAEVAGARFIEIKRGVDVEPSVLECVTRALDHPFNLVTDREQPFPEDLDAELPIEVVLGPPAGSLEDQSKQQTRRTP